jgi:hypothetical protein
MFHTPHSLDTNHEFLHPQEDQLWPFTKSRSTTHPSKELHRVALKFLIAIKPQSFFFQFLLQIAIAENPFHQACYILYASNSRPRVRQGTEILLSRHPD